MGFVTSGIIGQAGSATPQSRTVPGLPRSQPVARHRQFARVRVVGREARRSEYHLAIIIPVLTGALLTGALLADAGALIFQLW